jgi:hypothetical protein
MGYVIAVGAVAEVMSVARLWLWLRSRSRRDDARRRRLIELTRALPPGGCLAERDADGAVLILAAPVRPTG